MNFEYLTQYLDTLPGKDCAPGVDCKVTYEGEEVYRHSSGWFDMEEKILMRQDARYFMYSTTKPLTSVTALTLYEKGAFLLTDPLYEYIPEFKDMYVKHIIDGKEEVLKAQNTIRVMDLFTMSAGLSYNLGYKALEKVKKATNGKCPTVEVAKALAKEPLEFEPGTRFMYSLCHDILGALVEVVSGKQFSEYMKGAVLEPLDMTSTGFEADNTDLMASQYAHNPDDDTFTKIAKDCKFKLGSEYESGGAGLISTVDDYSKFTSCIANYGYTQNGENILSKATIDLMRTNFLDDVQLKDFRSNNAPHRVGYGYGLGVRTMIDPANGGVNSSLGEIGWPGASGTYTLMDVNRNLSIVFAEHTIGSMRALHNVHPRIRNIVYSCLDK